MGGDVAYLPELGVTKTHYGPAVGGAADAGSTAAYRRRRCRAPHYIPRRPTTAIGIVRRCQDLRSPSASWWPLWVGRLERLVSRHGRMAAELLVQLGEVDRRKLRPVVRSGP